MVHKQVRNVARSCKNIRKKDVCVENGDEEDCQLLDLHIVGHIFV